MKFNARYLSIPPYISTSWDNIKTLQMSGNQLLISLSDASLVRVPDLDLEEIEQLFAAHSAYLELSENAKRSKFLEKSKDLFSELPGDLFIQKSDFPFKIGFSNGSENLGFGMLQHNMAYYDAPDMPGEFLSKIEAISKILSPEVLMSVPKAEPHCNCPHCQIARVIYKREESETLSEPEVEEELIVHDSELKFNQWVVESTEDKNLFNVVSKLDPIQRYSVYLGNPIGCTCGEEGCVHLLTVLYN